MHSSWQDGNQKRSVVSPLSLIITATGHLQMCAILLLRNCKPMWARLNCRSLIWAKEPIYLGGSCLAQVYNELEDQLPDVNETLPYYIIFSSD
ncbi:hypothetical protein [Candidatus Coxiella mudrowiae]|uniref:hypothetical protein n=1 Tax=Candidatus Coxiella mudrowiae TaxID=2054173 RepID=UPI001FD25AC4|nr:hypothetical protein [Candidatus Coxiella mudrowiae]